MQTAREMRIPGDSTVCGTWKIALPAGLLLLSGLIPLGVGGELVWFFEFFEDASPVRGAAVFLLAPAVFGALILLVTGLFRGPIRGPLAFALVVTAMAVLHRHCHTADFGFRSAPAAGGAVAAGDGATGVSPVAEAVPGSADHPGDRGGTPPSWEGLLTGSWRWRSGGEPVANKTILSAAFLGLIMMIASRGLVRGFHESLPAALAGFAGGVLFLVPCFLPIFPDGGMIFGKAVRTISGILLLAPLLLAAILCVTGFVARVRGRLGAERRKRAALRHFGLASLVMWVGLPLFPLHVGWVAVRNADWLPLLNMIRLFGPYYLFAILGGVSLTACALDLKTAWLLIARTCRRGMALPASRRRDSTPRGPGWSRAGRGAEAVRRFVADQTLRLRRLGQESREEREGRRAGESPAAGGTTSTAADPNSVAPPHRTDEPGVSGAEPPAPPPENQPRRPIDLRPPPAPAPLTGPVKPARFFKIRPDGSEDRFPPPKGTGGAEAAKGAEGTDRTDGPGGCASETATPQEPTP